MSNPPEDARALREREQKTIREMHCPPDATDTTPTPVTVERLRELREIGVLGLAENIERYGENTIIDGDCILGKPRNGVL